MRCPRKRHQKRQYGGKQLAMRRRLHCRRSPDIILGSYPISNKPFIRYHTPEDRKDGLAVGGLVDNGGNKAMVVQLARGDG